MHGFFFQNVMGDLYYYGTRGVQRDLNRAVQYYEMGAEQGDPGGLFNLGVSALRVSLALFSVLFCGTKNMQTFLFREI